MLFGKAFLDVRRLPERRCRQMIAGCSSCSYSDKDVRNRYRFPEKFAGEIRAFEKTRLGVPFVVLVN